MRLTTCLYHFFDQYLPHVKGCSANTVKSYRDTFTIFLPFAAAYHGIKIDSLTPEHLSAHLVLSFLQSLEADRHNTARSRNQRLAVVKSLAKMIRFMYPDKVRLAESILAIPQKRCPRKLIGFLYPQEIGRILQNVNLTRKDGFRDYTLLHLLYDSGARAAEIASLRLDYFEHQNRTLAILGKGKRYRQIKLLPRPAASSINISQSTAAPPTCSVRIICLSTSARRPSPATASTACVENTSTGHSVPNASR